MTVAADFAKWGFALQDIPAQIQNVFSPVLQIGRARAGALAGMEQRKRGPAPTQIIVTIQQTNRQHSNLVLHHLFVFRAVVLPHNNAGNMTMVVGDINGAGNALVAKLAMLIFNVHFPDSLVVQPVECLAARTDKCVMELTDSAARLLSARITGAELLTTHAQERLLLADARRQLRYAIKTNALHRKRVHLLIIRVVLRETYASTHSMQIIT